MLKKAIKFTSVTIILGRETWKINTGNGSGTKKKNLDIGFAKSETIIANKPLKNWIGKGVIKAEGVKFKSENYFMIFMGAR